MAVKKDLMNLEKKQTLDNLYSVYKSSKKEIYKKVASMLESSRRNMISVNLSKLEKLNNVIEGSIVIVPGKILGVGNLEKKITVYAYSFSKSAKEKLDKNAKTFDDFTKDKIDFKKCVIIK